MSPSATLTSRTVDEAWITEVLDHASQRHVPFVVKKFDENLVLGGSTDELKSLVKLEV
jgi:hypothetical protein